MKFDVVISNPPFSTRPTTSEDGGKVFPTNIYHLFYNKACSVGKVAALICPPGILENMYTGKFSRSEVFVHNPIYVNTNKVSKKHFPKVPIPIIYFITDPNKTVEEVVVESPKGLHYGDLTTTPLSGITDELMSEWLSNNKTEKYSFASSSFGELTPGTGYFVFAKIRDGKPQDVVESGPPIKKFKTDIFKPKIIYPSLNKGKKESLFLDETGMYGSVESYYHCIVCENSEEARKVYDNSLKLIKDFLKIDMEHNGRVWNNFFKHTSKKTLLAE